MSFKPKSLRFLGEKSKQKPPRPFDELQKLAQELTYRLGDVNYRISVFQHEVETLTAELRQVNEEGARRAQLDKKAKSESEQTQEKQNDPATA